MTTDNRKPIELKSVSRRKAVKQIVGGVSALAAYNMLPVKWETPIIEQIFLPAHAAVSGITLSDPCTAELVSGNQESSIDVIRVSGFVTPPVGGLAVTIVGTPNGGSGGPVTVTTSTAADGTYSAEVAMVGGPGIAGVGATATVAGINGAAHCSVGIPPADHPSANRPQPPQVILSIEGRIAPCGDDLPISEGGQTYQAQLSPPPDTDTTVKVEFFRNGASVGSADYQLFASGFTNVFSFVVSNPQPGDTISVVVTYPANGATAQCINTFV